jgi:hypothetical protein
LTGSLRGQSDSPFAPPGFELSSEWKVGGYKCSASVGAYKWCRSRRDTFKRDFRYGPRRRSLETKREWTKDGDDGVGGCEKRALDSEDFVYSVNKINAGPYCTELAGHIDRVPNFIVFFDMSGFRRLHSELAHLMWQQ